MNTDFDDEFSGEGFEHVTANGLIVGFSLLLIVVILSLTLPLL
jgi:hypothetical protein